MSNILASAAKIVFILMACGVIVALFEHIIDPKDFMSLATMVFAFYFVIPTGGSPNEPTVGK